ncbi:MAG: cysteine hydrolase family protein [Hyphomonadaceae bacterium]
MHAIDLPEWAVTRGRALRPLQALNPETTALLVVDMQNFFLDGSQPLSSPHTNELVKNVNRLSAALRQVGGEVVWIRHSFAAQRPPEQRRAGDVGASLHAELLPGRPAFELHPDLGVWDTDRQTVKTTASVFHPRSGSDLLDALRAKGIDTVIVAGVVTNGCCETTARDAAQHGLRVLFAADGTSALTDAEHNAALLNLMLWFADVRPVDELIAFIESGAHRAPKAAGQSNP